MRSNLTPFLTSLLIPVILVWLLRERKKEKKEEEEIKKGKYTIGYRWQLKAFMCFGLLLFGTAFIVCLGNDLHWWKANSETWVTVGFGLILLFFLYCVAGTCIWRIKVDGDDIAYRNMFGITKHYKKSEIDHVEYGKTKYIFYRIEKKLFAIDDNAGNGVILANAIKKEEMKRKKLEAEKARATAQAENPAAFENLPDSRENRNGKKNKGKDKNRKNTDSKKKKR